MVNPKSLMYWVDNWRDADPGEIGGKKLNLIAIQHARRLRNLWRKRPKNLIYKIGNTREIVYKRYSKSPAVMKMGISIKRLGNHPNAVSMEKYAKYFIDKKNPDWLERNNYELV